jgi:hypothetical protein
LLIIVERLPRAARVKSTNGTGIAPGFIPNSGILPDIFNSLRIRASFWGGLRPGVRQAWFWSALGLVLVGALGPVFFRSNANSSTIAIVGDIVFSLGSLFLIPAAAAWAFAGLSSLYVLPRQEKLATAFVLRDWHGGLGPDDSTVALLGKLASDPTLRDRLLIGQPASVVVVCCTRLRNCDKQPSRTCRMTHRLNKLHVSPPRLSLKRDERRLSIRPVRMTYAALWRSIKTLESERKRCSDCQA